MFGTDLAVILHDRGFRGLFIIRSSDSTEGHIRSYLQTGAVDACLGKDKPHKHMVSSILREYLKKTRQQEADEIAAEITAREGWVSDPGSDEAEESPDRAYVGTAEREQKKQRL